MSNASKREEYRQIAGALWTMMAILSVPMFIPGLFSPDKSLVMKIAAIAICSVLLIGTVYYQRKYAIELKAKWNWRPIGDAWPDLSFAETLPWYIRIVGWIGLLAGLWFCSSPFWLPVRAERAPQDVSMLFSAVWIGGWLIIGSLYFGLLRYGVFVFNDSRTVTAWWGLIGPMFRQDFPFDDFTDTSIHLITPKDFTDRRHWRVWLREPTSSVAIRARNQEDARQIGRQLAEIIGVKYWPPPDEAQETSTAESPP